MRVFRNVMGGAADVDTRKWPLGKVPRTYTEECDLETANHLALDGFVTRVMKAQTSTLRGKR